MEELTFEQKIEDIKKDRTKKHPVTPWEITNSYGYCRRSWGLAQRVNLDLDKEGLELSGDFYHAWFYAELTLQNKQNVATTRVTTNPIKRVDSIAAATINKPIYVDKKDSTIHAITLMQQHGFSQLPVVDGDETRLCGNISWKTIGSALWHNKKNDTVEDCMENKITAIYLDTPLLDAIQLISANKFVVVLNGDKTFSGFITSSDTASEFFSITQAEAFLLLEQIELQIRLIIGRIGVSKDDIKKNSMIKKDEPSIDDLTFGGYCKIFEESHYWEKLNLKNDHTDFNNYLKDIKVIRNRVMHFEPEGIEPQKMQSLRNMTRYLSEIIDYLNSEK